MRPGGRRVELLDIFGLDRPGTPAPYARDVPSTSRAAMVNTYPVTASPGAAPSTDGQDDQSEHEEE